MSKRTFEMDFDGRKLSVEVGEMAKQAAGAALIRYEDTAVLSVCAVGKRPTTMSYFPLMVIYQEKMYAAGKIPGGFFKREGRPSDNETLTARLIDRPIRPLFPKGFMYDLQIINQVMSADTDNTPEMTAMFGSSLALGISDIPFQGPIAGVNVGMIDGKYVINPTQEQQEISTIELSIAGTKDGINMVESSASQVSEEDMLGAILFGHEWIKKLCEFQEEIIAEVGLPDGDYEYQLIPDELTAAVTELVGKELIEAVRIEEKLERGAAIAAITDRVATQYEENNKDLERPERNDLVNDVRNICSNIVKKEMRRLVTEDKVRPDGRKLDEIRPLDSQIDLFELTHGSAMFTRGQTQAVALTTLGSMSEYKVIDGMEDEIEKKTFMLHYNFPQFSVGETGRYGGPGRREIGHGMLGERALRQVMPNDEEFPYTVRVVSEILESNGSSSQATICAGSMSLMAAGVPIKAQVAGIAMGLIKEGDFYSILTDIQGMEDHYGDMDFKVAGTEAGITALQMDIKIEGLSKDILEESLHQAKKARLEILNHMNEVISEPRKEVSKHAPKVKMFHIDPDKIRDVIGPGGKQITQIIEDCNNVKIDIEQDGRVFIMHSNLEDIEKAIAIIEEIVKEAKVGEVYSGKVVRVEKFGCFVELWPGTDGLCHISKLAHERVAKVEDVAKLGDIITVKVIGIDDRGRIDLSRKATLPKPPRTEKQDHKPYKKDSKPNTSDK
ncbi:polyribonucleotide nucleotidyltransferase [Candidatus Xianfuyuplasma coldseepsis]|uniref:Polyribonucleotide nucleotidyltransferase n=1 Tax=Candidatus Xianfuyuplasma coldseepsis TaxID=2782163 RepID=A0A7L7KSR5_9MOLU|nr:polyribonucleotide nucleotidyltransferase [Xianfuyuplasma coldseepsis]QMS85860.1 polyribonucleotide nucleotidyltransferase [Xianfuyuplasma coldseepsis]